MSRIIIAECVLEIICLVKESSCDKLRVIVGVLCYVDALLVYFRLLIFRFIRCIERSFLSTVRFIIRLEVMIVIFLMRVVCSVDNCNVRLGFVVSVVEKRKISLFFVNR